MMTRMIMMANRKFGIFFSPGEEMTRYESAQFERGKEENKKIEIEGKEREREIYIYIFTI